MSQRFIYRTKQGHHFPILEKELRTFKRFKLMGGAIGLFDIQG
jgi:hypothetical protein